MYIDDFLGSEVRVIRKTRIRVISRKRVRFVDSRKYPHTKCPKTVSGL